MRYHCISLSIWNDNKFPFISDDCQLVFFHLLTTPTSTQFGLFKGSIEGLAAEKRWPVSRYRKAFAEAIDNGFIRYDDKALLIYIPNFLKYNRPGALNVLKSWGKQYRELPSSHLMTDFWQSAHAILKGISDAFGDAFLEAFPKPSGKASPMPPDTDTDRLLKEGVQGENSRPRPSRKPPPGFEPDDELRAWAVEQGMSASEVDAETAQFLDHEFATPRTDWRGAWRNWIRRSLKMQPPGGRSQGAGGGDVHLPTYG